MAVYQSEVLVVSEFAVETTPGDLTTPNKRFHTLMVKPSPKKPTTAAREAGNKFATGQVPGQGHTESALSGDASVQDLTYLAAATLGTPQWTTLAAAGESFSGAQFVPNPTGVGTFTGPIQTLSVLQGLSGAGNANGYGYGFCSALNLAFTPDKQVAVSGTLMGRQRLVGQTLAASPTVLGASLLFPTEVLVYLSTSEAGLDDPANLCDPFTVSWKCDKVSQAVYALNGTNTFGGTAEDAPDLQYDIVLPYGPLSDSLEQAIDNNTLYYIRVLAKGGFISGTSGPRNAAIIDSPVSVTNPAEGATTGARHASFTLVGQSDSTFNGGTGGALRMFLQSALTAL